MIDGFDFPFRPMVPTHTKTTKTEHMPLANGQMGGTNAIRKKKMCEQTFNAAAEGSSGSPKNGFVFSLFRLFVCRVRTSPILNTTGVETPKQIEGKNQNKTRIHVTQVFSIPSNKQQTTTIFTDKNTQDHPIHKATNI